MFFGKSLIAIRFPFASTLFLSRLILHLVGSGTTSARSDPHLHSATDSPETKGTDMAAATKTALVIGAKQGIGLELAKKFHAKGYVVYGTVRSLAKDDEKLSAVSPPSNPSVGFHLTF